MSEDDGIALVTRRLIREHELFSSRIKIMVVKNGKYSLATGNAMSPADKPYLMAIESFRKCNTHLLPAHLTGEFSKKQQIPSFDSLEEAYTSIAGAWDKLIKAVDPWKELLKAEATVEKYRIPTGGHILVRPIGITAFIGAVSADFPSLSIKHIKTVVSRFSELSESPWSGVLWNSTTRRMNVTVAAERLARRLWRYLLGLDEDKAALTHDWRAMVEPGNAATTIKLPVQPKAT